MTKLIEYAVEKCLFCHTGHSLIVAFPTALFVGIVSYKKAPSKDLLPSSFFSLKH